MESDVLPKPNSVDNLIRPARACLGLRLWPRKITMPSFMERASMSTWVPILNVSMYVAENFQFSLGTGKVKMKELGIGSSLKQVLDGRLGFDDIEQEGKRSSSVWHVWIISPAGMDTFSSASQNEKNMDPNLFSRKRR